MRCMFCSRQAAHELTCRSSEPGKPDTLYMCEACATAFREGFEHGRVYEAAARRARGNRHA